MPPDVWGVPAFAAAAAAACGRVTNGHAYRFKPSPCEFFEPSVCVAEKSPVRLCFGKRAMMALSVLTNPYSTGDRPHQESKFAFFHVHRLLRVMMSSRRPGVHQRTAPRRKGSGVNRRVRASDKESRGAGQVGSGKGTTTSYICLASRAGDTTAPTWCLRKGVSAAKISIVKTMQASCPSRARLHGRLCCRRVG